MNSPRPHKLAGELPLPFPPDPQQIELLRWAAENGGHAIASEGTARFECLSHLVDSGHMSKHLCEKALGVYQFSVTNQGREAIA